MQKLIYNHHYYSKKNLLHYYMGMIFTDKAWDNFIKGKSIHGRTIDINSKYRLPPHRCERWYNQDNHKTSIARPCLNKVKVRCDQTGIYFCNHCAKIISNMAKDYKFKQITTFTSIN